MSPNDPANPAADALKLTTELVETAVESLLDGTDLGATAGNFLRDHQDRLVGLSVSAFKSLVETLKGAKTADDLHEAKLAYVRTLSYADLLLFQETSAEALASHANAQVRASSFFDAVADVGTRVVPKLVPALLKIVL